MSSPAQRFLRLRVHRFARSSVLPFATFALALPACSSGAAQPSSGAGSGADLADAAGAAETGAQTYDDAGPPIYVPYGTTDVTDASDAPTCDLSQGPSENPCMLDDAYGVFVAPPVMADGGSYGGTSTGNGTKEAPYATLSAAVANLHGKTNIFVCSGTAPYTDRVTLDAAHPANIFGGLACAGATGWSYVGGVADVMGPYQGESPTLTITSVSGLRIEDMAFHGPDVMMWRADGSSVSSVAAWVVGSSVTFARTALMSLPGGAAGPLVGTPNNYDPAQPAPAGFGENAVSQSCPPGAISPPADSSTGGAGAHGTQQGESGSAIPPAPVVVGTGRDGLGGMSTTGDIAQNGDDGADGEPRFAGGPSASFGVLTDTAWNPARGTAGQAGTPGQGGGGGGSSMGQTTTTFYYGGSGGAGGCGGSGGLGGNGGGASIALVSVRSTVVLTDCSLASFNGGSGGPGGTGEDGQAGAPGQTIAVDQPALGAAGGTGGNGAGGSGGGGGAGGISVGILYSGAAPTSDADTTINLGYVPFGGSAGSGGVRGAGGQNALGTAPSGAFGATGLAGAYFSVKNADAP